MIVRLKRLQTCFLSTAQLFYSATGHFVIVIRACFREFMRGRPVLGWAGGCSGAELCIFMARGYHRYRRRPSWGEALACKQPTGLNV